MTRLERFGWRGAVEPGIGRVVSAHGDYYHLVCNEAEGEILARKKKSAFVRMKTPGRGRPGYWDGAPARGRVGNVTEPIFPMTGDFVRFRYNDRGDSMLTEVLPRFSHFERRDPTARRTAQTLAVNFDTLFVMMSLNENFSLPRLERYLALAEDVGEAEVVVVLTKRDLEGAEEVLSSAGDLTRFGAKVCVISSLNGDGMDEINPFVQPGRTLAFIGSSGVGKSTLLNVLAGEEWAATQEIQEWSGKGRHTTTSRELVMLPSGAMVIDTPGIREIGMVDEEDDVLAKGVSTHRWRLK